MASPAEDEPAARRLAVLVTRPANRSAALCSMLRAQGAEVFLAPMLGIEALPVTPAMLAIARRAAGFDWLIATSVNAVRLGLPLLADALTAGSQWPQCFAVGAETARCLAAHGINAIAPTDSRSEGLLALPALAEAAGRRVLLLTGEGGRGLLETELAARGGEVLRLAVYRRVAPVADEPSLEAFRQRDPRHHRRAVLVTSREAMQNLLARAPWLTGSEVAMVVPSTRVAAAAREAGLRRVIEAGGADDASQLAALASLTAPNETPGRDPDHER